MSAFQTPSIVGGGSTEPPAAVTPRGHRRRSKAALPIDRLVLPLIRPGSKGIVLIVAPPGGGKSTALAYLRSVLPADARVLLFDAHQIAAAQQAAISKLVLLTAADPPTTEGFVDVLELSSWSLDDCLEYLVAAHREECESVLSRLHHDQSLSAMRGSPQLLSLAMDAMAGDSSLTSSREILRQHVQGVLSQGLALDRLILDGPIHVPLVNEQWRWWRHEIVQQICIADWIAEQLSQEIIPKHLTSIDENAYLIPHIAAAIAGRPVVIEFLGRWLDGHRHDAEAPMLASVLLALDANWRPADGREFNLCGAQLSAAKWADIDMRDALLTGANLAGADLSGADLSGAKADGANLNGARLRAARLLGTILTDANLASADLSKASASHSDFSAANLESANLSSGVFHEAGFANANLSGVQAISGDFYRVRFYQVNLNEADFTDANLTWANLVQADLSSATWTGACFARADLRNSKLEGVEIPSANFEHANLSGCLLTASRMPGGRFRNADLTKTGLADIDWEDADLRGANFAQASFHMGSTRSGLVGSTIPCEGSRTGFYTDEFNEQLYKSPEEIRKACLCGANLVGAQVDKTDFYLVDLRRAIYSKSQARHFSRSGAILRSAKR